MRDKLLAAQAQSPKLQGGLDAGPQAIEDHVDASTTDIDIALDDQLGTEFADRVSCGASITYPCVVPLG